MVQFARTSIALAATLAIAFSGAEPARAVSQVAQVSATVAKPLTLARVDDLDLGSIVLGPGTWSGATVGISRIGVFTCTNANVTCTGATKVAKVLGPTRVRARGWGRSRLPGSSGDPPMECLHRGVYFV